LFFFSQGHPEKNIIGRFIGFILNEINLFGRRQSAGQVARFQKHYGRHNRLGDNFTPKMTGGG